MSQLWTIIFVALLAIGFGLASWHDREDKKRQQQRREVNQLKKGEPES
jgi:hypothetical protein